MTRRWLLQANALLLAALLFSGGGGLPLVDLLLFHTGTSAQPTATQVAASAAPVGHGQLCHLGCTLSHTPRGMRPGVELRVVGPSLRRRIAHTDSTRLPVDGRRLAQPRAPPSLFV